MSSDRRAVYEPDDRSGTQAPEPEPEPTDSASEADETEATETAAEEE